MAIVLGRTRLQSHTGTSVDRISMKRKMAILKKFILGVGVTFLGSVTGYAQTPTLSLARGNTGISANEAGRASNFEFQMESAGWPHAVTAGETVFMFGSWPTGSNPTITDDQSNSWSAVSSCNDSGGMTHGFFYAVNAATNTSIITETHSSPIGNGVFDWAHFYNMSTTPSGFVDASSCKTGVAPANNSAPNINGTAYTATSGDLILTCVYVEGSLGQIQGGANAITSITWPAGFSGLNEDTFYGHACAYGVASGGSFTPTFTIAQGSHSSFTIMSAAFKAGSGGTAPGNGAAILLSEVHYTTGSGQTDTINLPCPSSTTAVAVADDAASITGVADSGSNTWQSATVPGEQLRANILCQQSNNRERKYVHSEYDIPLKWELRFGWFILSWPHQRHRYGGHSQEQFDIGRSRFGRDLWRKSVW